MSERGRGQLQERFEHGIADPSSKVLGIGGGEIVGWDRGKNYLAWEKLASLKSSTEGTLSTGSG